MRSEALSLVNSNQKREKRSEFFTAVEANNHEKIRGLINDSKVVINVNEQNSVEHSLLIMAVRNQNSVLVRWLCAHGAKVGHRDKGNRSAYDYAVDQYSNKIISKTLERYAGLGDLSIFHKMYIKSSE